MAARYPCLGAKGHLTLERRLHFQTLNASWKHLLNRSYEQERLVWRREVFEYPLSMYESIQSDPGIMLRVLAPDVNRMDSGKRGERQRISAVTGICESIK